MSAADSPPDGGDGDRYAPPPVDLAWRCDDADDCDRLTVFDPDAEDVTTRWITVDREAAVPLDEVR